MVLIDSREGVQLVKDGAALGDDGLAEAERRRGAEDVRLPVVRAAEGIVGAEAEFGGVLPEEVPVVAHHQEVLAVLLDHDVAGRGGVRVDVGGIDFLPHPGQRLLEPVLLIDRDLVELLQADGGKPPDAGGGVGEQGLQALLPEEGDAQLCRGRRPPEGEGDVLVLLVEEGEGLPELRDEGVRVRPSELVGAVDAGDGPGERGEVPVEVIAAGQISLVKGEDVCHGNAGERNYLKLLLVARFINKTAE